MSQKKKIVAPDSICQSRLVTLLINRILQSGKKSLAQTIVYNALELILQKTKENPTTILKTAVKNVTPQVEVKAKRVRGSVYQIPMEVRSFKGTNIACKWIIESARARSGKNMSLKLSNELLDAAKKTGNSIRKREQSHKLAYANKAFSHVKY